MGVSGHDHPLGDVYYGLMDELVFGWKPGVKLLFRVLFACCFPASRLVLYSLLGIL